MSFWLMNVLTRIKMLSSHIIMEQLTRKAHLITLLDSLSFGLLYIFINPNFIKIGGNHLDIAYYAASIVLIQLIADDIRVKSLAIHGRKKCLLIFLATGAISHLIISSSKSTFLIILSRSIFILTNHVRAIIKDVVLNSISQEEHEEFIKKHTFLTYIGLILGPIISGYLFTYYTFSYSCLIAAVLTLANIYIVQTVPITEEKLPTEEIPLIEKKSEELREFINSLEKCDINQNWDLLAIRYLFDGSIAIFSTKFSLLLMHNYNSTFFACGITVSFFTLTNLFLVPIVKDLKEKYATTGIFTCIQNCLIAQIASLTFSCYSPEITGFIVASVLILSANCYMNLTWDELFSSRKNVDLNIVQKYVGVIAQGTAQFFFAIFANFIGHYAAIAFIIGPTLVAFRIFNNNNNIEEEKEKED